MLNPLLYRKRAVPYFLALIQHIVIGDYLTGGTQFLWPISSNLYGLDIGISSLTNIALELVIFLISIAVMFKTKDVLLLVKHHPIKHDSFHTRLDSSLAHSHKFSLICSLTLAHPSPCLSDSLHHLYSYGLESNPDKKLKSTRIL